jgi:hypothetical protein
MGLCYKSNKPLDCTTDGIGKATGPRGGGPAQNGDYRFPRQNPQRWVRCEPSPTAACWASSSETISAALGSVLGEAWEIGVASRGSLRCLSAASMVVTWEAFLSAAGSVAVARAAKELETFWVGAAGVPITAIAAAAGAVGATKAGGAGTTGAEKAGVAAGAGVGGR